MQYSEADGIVSATKVQGPHTRFKLGKKRILKLNYLNINSNRFFRIYWIYKTHPHRNAASIKHTKKCHLRFKNPLRNFVHFSILK